MDLIPLDVWPLIASFLEDKTKRLMRLVSTKWFNIIKYNNFKIYFAHKEDVPAITERLSKYSWPIKLTFSKSKFNGLLDVIDYLPKLTNLIGLKSDSMELEKEHVTLEQWMQLSVLTNLQAWQAFDDVPLELWNKFTNLTTWSRSKPEEALAPILQQMANLKKLHFYGETQTWPFALVPNPEKLLVVHVSAQQTIAHGGELWSRLTNLTRFTFTEKKDDNVSNTLNLQYLTALVRLSLLSNGTALPLLASNTNLKHLHLFCKTWSLSNAEALGGLKKLENLSFGIPVETDYPLQFQFLAHLTQLSYLAFWNGHDATIDDINSTLYKYMPPQLRTIETSDCDISKLTHLTNLESLLCHQITNVEQLGQFSNITRLIIRFVYENNVCCVGKLTRLEDLFLDVDGEGFVDGINQPDVSQLVHLTSLYWGYHNYEMNKIIQIKYLTKLENLTIGPNEQHNRLENCDFFANLTNLTCLKIECSILKEDSFWQNVIRLTNINMLKIRDVDHDDRLLLLTSLTNLTSLEIRPRENYSFAGVHFTAFTSLQSIYYSGDGSKLAHKREDILKSMPYLRTYSYFVPEQ